MRRAPVGVIVLGVLALTILGVVGKFVGWTEALVLLGGMLLLTATVWLSPFASRVLGSLYAAALTFVIARLMWGIEIGLGLAALVGIAAWFLLGVRVHRRICFMIPSLVLLIFVTCILMYSAPGSPFASERVQSDQVRAAQERKFDISDSALGFFTNYITRLVTTGSMGKSTTVQGRTVNELLLPALPVSVSLGLLALILAIGIGLFLGIRAGLRPNSFADFTSMGVALVGVSLPNFVIGATLILIFALKLGWLPSAGWGGYRHLVLPAITLALPYAAYIARLARTGTIDVMRQDFIRTARAKGLPDRAVVLKHALKGAILPVVSFLGPAAAGIMTGSFVVEKLFNIPGMGQWFVNGAINRDFSVVLGTAIIYFSMITFFNLAVDFAYAWLDPRTREDL